MNRIETINECCAIVGLAYRSIGDYSRACDCFCIHPRKKGETAKAFKARTIFEDVHYNNDSEVIDFMRKAVVEKLQRGGYAIDKRYDPITGIELVDMVRVEGEYTFIE